MKKREKAAFKKSWKRAKTKRHMETLLKIRKGTKQGIEKTLKGDSGV
jgi:hypothetical protein